MLKKYFAYRKNLKIFEREIFAIFRDWQICEYKASKGEYSLWIANGFSHFRDEGKKQFLAAFNESERKLIWEELQRFKQFGDGSLRENINKEFNLSNF